MAAIKLSPTMRDAMKYANDECGGKLKRFPGGFWCSTGEGYHYPWWGTSTIEALVKRGVATYTEWYEGQRARFPIEVTMLKGNAD